MNPTNNSRSDDSPPGARWPGEAGSACDDPRVIRALEEYQAELEAGYRPSREAFQRRYPEIAEALAGCLAGLEFVQVAAPQLCPPEAAPDASTVLVAEGPLGDYRLVREVGRGGMGVVYEAVQISLGRVVALKVLPFAAALDPRQLQRFKNEAQAAAHLHHPHIVPVYGVGCERGVHYYAMQFIEGQTLAVLIRELRAKDEGRNSNAERSTDNQALMTKSRSEEAGLGIRPSGFGLLSSFELRPSSFFRKAAELGIQAAEALEHAHQLGVIHRDIKPANLLVDDQGDLYVTDFGLARLGSEAGLTMTGDLLGTLRYMSPEQALARRVPADPRTDVYSLGVTLYELLTQEPAYNGQSRAEVLHQIANEEPAPPRRLNPAVPPELETIVLKAMAKSAEERYASAQELADDLRRFLEDKPIKARQPSLRQRAVKWARRHKTVVRAALVVLVLAMVALTVSTVFIWWANDGLKRALERERQNGYYQRIALADREWSANNLNGMLQLLEECPPDLRGWEWHYLNRLRFRVLPPLRHASAVFCAAFSPDGEQIASASQDGKVTFWDARSGQQLFQFQAHAKHARSVAFSPDGRLLATTSWDKTVKIWDVQMLATDRIPSPLHTLTHQGTVWNAVFSPDGQRLASAGNWPAPPGAGGGNLAEVKVWAPISGQELCTLEGQEGEIWSALAFSPDSQLLATGHLWGRDGIVGNVVHIWDANTGRKIRTLAGHTQPVQSVAFSPDGRWLASGSGNPSDFVGTDGELKLWDVASGRELFGLRGHLTVWAVAFSPDGRRLVSAGEDQTIKLWDTATGKAVITLRGHFGKVRSLAFSPDGTQLLSASHDMRVRIWDATTLSGQAGLAPLTLRGTPGGVAEVAFNPRHGYLASAGLDGNVRIWDAKSGKALRMPLGHKGPVLSIAFSADGRCLVSRDDRDETVTIWDTTAWKVIRTFRQPGNRWTHSVAFSPPDGKLLAVAAVAENEDRIVSLWDTGTWQEIHQLRGHSWNISAVAFDRTGRFLASADTDSIVRIWDVPAGKELVTLEPKHEAAVMGVTFSPDGNYLASVSLDQTVKIWNARTWKLLRAIPDAHGGIRSVAFASDSRRLAWGSTDATVKVADATTGQILETLRGHAGWVSSVAFSPDGRQIASASADGTVKIWPAPPVAELATATARNQTP